MVTAKTSVKTRFLSKFLPPSSRRLVTALLPITLTSIVGIAVLVPSTLSTQGRLAIFAFLVAAILWSTTPINTAYVALISVIFLVFTGGISQEQLYGSLASHVIWLMIGAFVLGGAVKKTGLATRLTQSVVARADTVGSLFWLLTTVLIPLSFVIPSTSARAAVTLPIFRSIAGETKDKRILRALALLIPTIILVSTIVSLLGAGSHLVANDLLQQITGQQISFGQWVLYGLPFGVAASYISCWVIMRLFLNQRRLHQKLKIESVPQKPFSSSELKTLGIILLTVILWLTKNWHGLEIATVSIFGAMLLTMPNFGVMKWKDGVNAVSWNLIIFVGAALVLGRSLISSGAAQWIIDRIFTLTDIAQTQSHPMIFLLLAFICLTSHLYITSHTARAVVLVPPFLYLATSMQLNPVAVLFFTTAAMDYCLTFPVSSKALVIYKEMDEEATYTPRDLLRLSAVMVVVHFALMILFYYTYWHWIGLSL